MPQKHSLAAIAFQPTLAGLPSFFVCAAVCISSHSSFRPSSHEASVWSQHPGQLPSRTYPNQLNPIRSSPSPP